MTARRRLPPGSPAAVAPAAGLPAAGLPTAGLPAAGSGGGGFSGGGFSGAGLGVAAAVSASLDGVPPGPAPGVAWGSAAPNADAWVLPTGETRPGGSE
jgi:hypothetical protein